MSSTLQSADYVICQSDNPFDLLFQVTQWGYHNILVRAGSGRNYIGLQQILTRKLLISNSVKQQSMYEYALINIWICISDKILLSHGQDNKS